MIPLSKGLTRRDPVRSRRFHGIIPSFGRDLDGIIPSFLRDLNGIALLSSWLTRFLTCYRSSYAIESQVLLHSFTTCSETAHSPLVRQTPTGCQRFIRRSMWKTQDCYCLGKGCHTGREPTLFRIFRSQPRGSPEHQSRVCEVSVVSVLNCA